MLTLSRKKGESVVVTAPDGTQLRMSIYKIDGGKVKLTFDGPKEMAVHRFEVQQKIDRQKGGAA
jgi:carbon storage regulator CsrA